MSMENQALLPLREIDLLRDPSMEATEAIYLLNYVERLRKEASELLTSPVEEEDKGSFLDFWPCPLIPFSLLMMQFHVFVLIVS